MRECLSEDGVRVVECARRVSIAGRAVKQDYAIYALALALAEDSVGVRKAAYDAIPDICRTASTLFQLLAYLKGRRGWSRGLRRAVAAWYDARETDALAYQVVKYRDRNGYTHRDAFRLCHPVAANTSEARSSLYAWVARKEHDASALPRTVRDYESAAAAQAVDLELVKRLPREALPSNWLAEPQTWAAMLEAGMPFTALLRNLGNLSKHGVLVANSDAARTIVERLTDAESIRKSRVHPIAIFLAQAVYTRGKSVKGSGTWAPVGAVTDALNVAYRLAFGNVEATGKRLLVAIDVSGSMRRARVADTPLCADEVALAMALVTVQTEQNVEVIGFDYQSAAGRGIYPVKIAPDERLRDVRARFSFGGGGTDCSLPFAYAKGKNFDALAIFTDHETWYGNIHAVQVLEELRRESKRRVKVVCAATTATGASIGDPADPDTLQISGFDASVPLAIEAFLRS